MEPIRKLADVVIETTQFNVHELRHFVTERFKNPDKRPMLVSVVSFGYRYGVPSDADLVLDVRFLPNPHFVRGCGRSRAKTRKCKNISGRFRRPGIPAPHGRIADLSDPALHPRRKKLSDHCLRLHRRKAPLGDAGESVRKALEKRGFSAKVIHRDIEK